MNSVEGLADVGGSCPNLKHLKIERCSMELWEEREQPPKTRLQLETLSLAGSRFECIMELAGCHLKQLDLSGTNIIDHYLRQITEV